MKEKKQKVTSLADLDRHSRTLIVREVLETMLAVNWFVGDTLNEDTLRALAQRFDVPFMALHVEVDGRVTPDDMREWCAFERGQVEA